MVVPEHRAGAGAGAGAAGGVGGDWAGCAAGDTFGTNAGPQSPISGSHAVSEIWSTRHGLQPDIRALLD